MGYLPEKELIHNCFGEILSFLVMGCYVLEQMV